MSPAQGFGFFLAVQGVQVGPAGLARDSTRAVEVVPIKRPDLAAAEEDNSQELVPYPSDGSFAGLQRQVRTVVLPMALQPVRKLYLF